MKDFLDKYDTVIFDMDGVITSEQNYWNSAALTVREYLSSAKYFGDKAIDAGGLSADALRIRAEVFSEDKLINELKSRGVNSNWDLGYVTVLISLITGTDEPGTILEYASGLSVNILDEYNILAEAAAAALGKDKAYTERNGELWTAMRDCFQEWFLGDEIFTEQYSREPAEVGKPGLLHSERPIIPMDKLIALLDGLSKEKRVCTGTGRPYAELITPLRAWDTEKYFAKNGLCSYDDVAAAEKRLGETALTKPHPYMFLKALYGTDYDDARILAGDYDKAKIERTLVVGDAGADILAAKAMGADFCAVLTGVAGEGARGYFEELGAEYILPSAAELL